MTAPPAPALPAGGEMTVIEHLRELRTRLVVSLCAVTLGALVTYGYSGVVFDLLTRSYFDYFPRDSLIGTGPAEAFVLKLKVAFFSSLVVTSPVVFHQVWLFVAPGLYEHERRLVFPFVACATALFLAGCYACHTLVVPVTLAFFKSQYDSIAVTPQIRVSEHLSMVLRAVLGFGVMCEAPVVTFLLARAGMVDHRTLLGWFRYAVVGIFVAAAVLTPTPDVMTQTLFALPLLALYGLSIGVAWAAGGRGERRDGRRAAASDEPAP